MKLYVDQDAPRQADQLQFKLDRWIDNSPFERLLGMKILSAADGAALLSLPFAVKLCNGGGVMHGGALAALADTAVAMAIKSLLPEGSTFATTELSMEFLAPVEEGAVTARAEVEGPGGRTFYGRCEISREDGTVCARLKTVFKLVRKSSDARSKSGNEG